MDGHSQSVTLPVIALQGQPGAGKSTQARLLTDRFGLALLSTGDLSRAAIAGGTETGRVAANAIRAGRMVPDGIALTLPNKRRGPPDVAQGIVLDRFRRPGRRQRRSNRFSPPVEVGAAVALTIDEAASGRRISGRRTCACCGEGYHDSFRPPAEADSAPLAARPVWPADPTTHAKAWPNGTKATAQTAPLFKLFAQRGALFRVDAMRSIDEIVMSLGGVARALVS